MDVHRNVKYEARILAKEIMNSKLNRLNIVTVCGTALLIAVALRSIARRRNLPKNDIDALLVYLRKADNAMRPEGVDGVFTIKGQRDAGRAHRCA